MADVVNFIEGQIANNFLPSEEQTLTVDERPQHQHLDRKSVV